MGIVNRDMTIEYDEPADIWIASEECADGTQVVSYFSKYSEAKTFKRGSGSKLIEPCPGNIARSRRTARELMGRVKLRNGLAYTDIEL